MDAEPKTFQDARENAIVEAMATGRNATFTWEGKTYTITIEQAEHLFKNPHNEHLFGK